VNKSSISTFQDASGVFPEAGCVFPEAGCVFQDAVWVFPEAAGQKQPEYFKMRSEYFLFPEAASEFLFSDW